MRDKFLPFSPPLIGDEEKREVVATLDSDWITTGPKTKQFEREFITFLKGKEALALNSCTAGLHTALITLGIGSGDEVITTPMTFASTVNVIEHVGAKPVLVDVEPDTLNIDPEKIEAAITFSTKAIIPVHYSGHPAELDAIKTIAEKNNLYIIEDAAHALPAKYKGQFIGSGENPTAFSFYATKNLTTAEGGMLTGSSGFIEKARIVSLHGMSKDAWKRYDKAGSWYYEVIMPGFKYNMTDIQASIGLWQLKKLEKFQQRRREIVQAYNNAFSVEDALEIPTQRPEVEHAWHLYALRLKDNVLKINRDQFIEELKDRKIGTSVHFIPIHLHPYYRDKYGYRPTDFPVVYSNFQRILSLPLNPRLSDEDVNDVIEAVLEIVKKFRR
ncbi:MAG TPA: DegT/DnrJ/EryC1/StrS aminotransferase family protein [Chitinophagaceae bacterium]|nr:DegT/DnrJ/EryC1/StrS aminotransferase family protein [Chitinophagaceae bacterium]